MPLERFGGEIHDLPALAYAARPRMLNEACVKRLKRPIRDAGAGVSSAIFRYGIVIGSALMLSACGTTSTRDARSPVARAPDATSAPATRAPDPTSAPAASAPARPATPRGGGYYLDDGPGDNPPPNLEQVPDAVPRPEPLHRGTMRPYTVMGQSYTPMTSLRPYKARGVASWYGRRYHGRPTSSGEIYDMYAMTAAHTVLPIPSYVRVTNPSNGKSIVVRVNDRGPFHSDRLIDLSYTAAYKLGLLGGGRAMVEVETVIADAGTPLVPSVAAASPVVPTAPTVVTGALVAAPAPAAVPLSAEPDAALAAGKPDAAPPNPVVPMAIGMQGIFLQLGAFGSQDNADTYLTRLRSQIDWLGPALHVYPKEGLYRVHAGPYANQFEARAAADRISQALGLKPMVLVR